MSIHCHCFLIGEEQDESKRKEERERDRRRATNETEMMRFMRSIDAYVTRILESIHFTFFTRFRIFLVKVETRTTQTSTRLFLLCSSRYGCSCKHHPREQLFSPLKSTAYVWERERKRKKPYLAARERDRETERGTLTVLIINRAHTL